MGVAKNSTREYVVNKTVSELNDINDILSSDADNSQQVIIFPIYKIGLEFKTVISAAKY